MIELNIINGTHWLNLGGDVETFEAVIGQPPSTSSEVTLLQALEQLNKVSWVKKSRQQRTRLNFIIGPFFSDFAISKEGFNTIRTKDFRPWIPRDSAHIFTGNIL